MTASLIVPERRSWQSIDKEGILEGSPYYHLKYRCVLRKLAFVNPQPGRKQLEGYGPKRIERLSFSELGTDTNLSCCSTF